MATTTLPEFLRVRRERLHPASTERRRTPGLRREEVAARAGVSVTWYTWLEQGRGGVPSDDVLERLARALELDDTNREMLFLLAHARPPPRRHTPPAQVTPSLQRVLDNLHVPALVKTPTFQIVAWNRAAVAVIGDYAAIPEHDRNMLRRVFHPESAAFLPHGDDMRRTCLAAFRVDIERAGASEEAAALVDELMAASEEFRRLWAENELSTHGVKVRRIVRPDVGELVFETSVFSVDDSDGLSMLVLSPADDASARGVEQLIRANTAGAS
ncbi:helix-turn-helix domain-containing protein [Corallococcus carmarthensis]|uniref:XRE family transcriptional regulator n=2 Tax=Corallococcus carmarthensis TaxID=2316728 RepID=A0A3A8L082_9BACT|nr:helix-turn-helix transcriptional regulator [Corallococcus carmarthensis]NOK15598.1 helix-turn-helix domain-containing protein [Corallococcus carmarthensis]RKH07892.1 XRE family transcriptional regulator [Corallococcus carmarthensis]